MTVHEHPDHDRIARAIRFLQANYRDQPSLARIAREVGMSPFHFQRIFADWAGVSPKKFVQHLSLAHAKRLLRQPGASVLGSALDTGLSGPARLHDLFVGIEAMTPGEFKSGGAALLFRHRVVATALGPVLLVSTDKGLARLVFLDSEPDALEALRAGFPNAGFHEADDPHQRAALGFFQGADRPRERVDLHLKGTPFQLQVWQALLRIPAGELRSYGNLASDLGRPGATRAVGSSVGRNPVACLIPCHRVIRGDGDLSGYRWGPGRKRVLIAWEAARREGGVACEDGGTLPSG